jgi:hypothetical protein
MTNHAKDKVLDRIEKLLAMADGGDLHEAEVAAKMASKYLLKYNLSMADVDTRIDNNERAITDELFEMGRIWKKAEGNWIVNMYSAVARNNLCKIILKPRYGGRNWSVIGKDIWVIGTRTNVDMIHFICQQLIPRVRTLEGRAWSEYQGWDKRGKFRRGFLIGATVGIGQQLDSQLRQMKKEEIKLDALIIYNDKAVEKYVGNKWPSLGKSRGSTTSSNDGYSQGKVAGNNMSIHKGVGGTTTSYGGLLKSRS